MWITPKSQVIGFILVLCTSSFSWSQSESQTRLNEVVEALKVREEQAQEQVNPLSSEEERLKVESEKIQSRLQQIQQEKDTVMADTALALNFDSIEIFFTQKHGRCKVQKSEVEGEYFIQKDEQKIRLLVAPDHSAKAPSVKKIEINKRPTLELTQTGWDPKNPNADSPFRALIKMDLQSQTITQSLFRGETIDERFMGFLRGQLPPETEITCVLF